VNRIESVPTTWDDARDGDFFRVVNALFSRTYLDVASLLLAANDDELTSLES
jgi:hypothetical protein